MNEFAAFCAHCMARYVVRAKTIAGAIRKASVNCNCHIGATK